MAHLVWRRIASTFSHLPSTTFHTVSSVPKSTVSLRHIQCSLMSSSVSAPGYTPTPESKTTTLADVPPNFLKYPVQDACQILKLPDGRHLSYGSYGSKSPNAHPFIFIHGIPDTRLDACLLPSDQAIAEKLNIRWIGIDRPGYGLSTLQSGRTILSWVDDLKCLITYLKLSRYRIFSVSGGTGYALACAKLLPPAQLRSVGIGFGSGPWEAGLKGTSLVNHVGMWMWKKHPWLIERVLDRYVVPKVRESSLEELKEAFQKQAKYLPKVDRDVLGSEEMSLGLAKIFREVFRQGSAKGYVEDSKLATGHWGFELSEVEYPGIRLWYGEKDVNTPPEMGRYMAARLPNAKMKEYEGKTHFTIWDHCEEMLTDMLQDD